MLWRWRPITCCYRSVWWMAGISGGRIWIGLWRRSAWPLSAWVPSASRLCPPARCSMFRSISKQSVSSTRRSKPGHRRFAGTRGATGGEPYGSRPASPRQASLRLSGTCAHGGGPTGNVPAFQPFSGPARETNRTASPDSAHYDDRLVSANHGGPPGARHLPVWENGSLGVRSSNARGNRECHPFPGRDRARCAGARRIRAQ